MSKKVVPLLVSILILGGCINDSTIVSNKNNVLISSAKKTKNPETMVEKSNLEKNLAILSGKSSLKDGSTIAERGSVEGRTKTKDFIKATLEDYGYQVEKHNYRKNGDNLFVRLLAQEQTSEYILVGAHMDSVRNAGADDNGSGSTAVLEAARTLKSLENRKVNIIFAWFDEEELGLIGSYAMAKEFKKQGLKITSVHTLDMVGWDSDKDNKVEIEQPDGMLWDYYQMVNEKHKLNLPLSRTSSGDTDHVAFRESGFTSVGLCEEWVGKDTTPNYHKKSDTYETINFDYLTNTTKLVIAAVGDLSIKVAPPKSTKILPHSMFPSRKRHIHKEPVEPLG